MKYTPTGIAGVTIVDIEPSTDHRGFVSQSFSAQEFAEIGLMGDVAQTEILFSHTRGTVRGLHRQPPPSTEARLIRCTRGAISYVVVDVRPEAPTYGKHVMVELSADNHRALFVPPHVAHGFQTLRDKTEVSIQISGAQAPSGEEGFRFSEPEFGIKWPLPVTVISEADASFPKLEPVGKDVVVKVDVDRLLAPRSTCDSPAISARPARWPVHLSECGTRLGSDDLQHHRESGSA